jgi:hypothetical protein
MAGASLRHVLIMTNLVGVLSNALREGPCTVYAADLRVATDPLRHYTYPDVVVFCDPVEVVDEHRDTLTNPQLIAEVLSDSTEKNDRGAKIRALSRRARACRILARFAGSRARRALHTAARRGMVPARVERLGRRDRSHLTSLPAEDRRGVSEGDVRRSSDGVRGPFSSTRK